MTEFKRHHILNPIQRARLVKHMTDIRRGMDEIERIRQSLEIGMNEIQAVLNDAPIIENVNGAPTVTSFFQKLSLPNIQRALGDTVSVDDALVFRYGAIDEWNKTSFVGYPIQHQDFDTQKALEFQAIANVDLGEIGYTMAFLAILPINDRQFNGWGNRVLNPIYDANGTAAVGAVGLYEPNGQLMNVEPARDWFGISATIGRAGSGGRIGCTFARDAICSAKFRKRLFERHMLMAAHTNTGK